MNTLGMGTGMGIGMWILWTILVVAVVLIAKLLIIGLPGKSDKTSETPLEILQKRYASGEIDQDEFEQMKKELEK